MDYRHVVTLGMVAGIGFTVALFVSVAAFTDPGTCFRIRLKMGAFAQLCCRSIGDSDCQKCFESDLNHDPAIDPEAVPDAS